MLTRCPSCDTTFRITPEQLKARHGRVRCGQCETVFNALETLVEEATGTAPPVAEPAADVAAPAAVATAPTTQPQEAAAPQPATPGEADAWGETLVSAEIEPVPAPVEADEPAPAGPPPAPRSSFHALAEPEDDEPETLVDYEPAFDTLVPDEAPRRIWPWLLGTLFALLGLAGQAAYQYRVELGVMLPEAKPALQAACVAIGCDIPLPRKIELMSIESSDLHPAPANAAQLQLEASLKNRAAFVQAYPYLELTLTDTADKPLLRRVLAPKDYLPQDKPAAAGFAAGSTLAVSLTLEVKDLAPVGYRLYVFYP